MIKSFSDRRLKRLYERGDRSRVAPEMADKIENILGVLDRAGRIEAMNLPGFHLHSLRGGSCRVLECDRPRQLARDLPV